MICFAILDTFARDRLQYHFGTGILQPMSCHKLLDQILLEHHQVVNFDHQGSLSNGLTVVVMPESMKIVEDLIEALV